MSNTELIFFAIYESIYIAAFCFLLFRIAFQKGFRLETILWLIAAGAAVQVAAIGLRWQQTGRPPFISLYELVSAGSWFAVATYLACRRLKPDFAPAGAVVLPISFLMLGLAMMTGEKDRPMSLALASAWFWVHILFALLAYGCYILACGGAVLFLARHPAGPEHTLEQRLSKWDLAGYRLIGIGFVFHAVMIVSGSIWANQAWGRYWGWDPIETWSLVTWLSYGLYLHLHAIHGWRGRRMAWLAIANLALILFCFWAVPTVYRSLHSYMKL